jgi:hypothetical protein
VSIILNGRFIKRALETHPDYQFKPDGISDVHDICGTEIQPQTQVLNGRSIHAPEFQTAISPGYHTRDDFGDDGDDTIHTLLQLHPQASVFVANGSFPADGSLPTTVDLIFDSFLERSIQILSALGEAGANYSESDISYYLPPSFDIGQAVIEYAKLKWSRNIKNCSI